MNQVQWSKAQNEMKSHITSPIQEQIHTISISLHIVPPVWKYDLITTDEWLSPDTWAEKIGGGIEVSVDRNHHREGLDILCHAN